MKSRILDEARIGRRLLAAISTGDTVGLLGSDEHQIGVWLADYLGGNVVLDCGDSDETDFAQCEVTGRYDEVVDVTITELYEPSPEQLDFENGYVSCALWCGVIDEDEDGALLYSEWDEGDLSDEARRALEADAADFWESNGAMLSGFDASRAGHDFWLTRNGHGAGFWDGVYPDDIGRALTAAAKAYGSSNLIPYTDEDGNIKLESY